MAGIFEKIGRAVFGRREPVQPPAPKAPETQPGPSNAASRGAPSGQPSDFFPTRVGTTWSYAIELSGDPLYFKQIIWPAGQNQIGVMTRGRFAPGLRGRSRPKYSLKISIVHPAGVQGPLQDPGGVELSVLEDELGVYEGHQQLFWAVRSEGGFVATEVVAYDPQHPSAPHMGGGQWGSWGGASGHSMRPVFFGERPGTGISMGTQGLDMLVFEGIDTAKRAQWQGADVVRFVRRVKANEEKDRSDEISKAFEEHMWYASGKGLVELRQFVEGRETMRWTLSGFQAGPR